MDDLFQAAGEVQAQLLQQGRPFCFIGGLAVIRWGTPRVTRDLDVSVLAQFGQEAGVIAALLGVFPGRIPDAAAFAQANRVLLLRTQGGVEIDVSLAALPFEEEMFVRASDFEMIKGVVVRTCSAEDLVVMKAFANRPRDWSDIDTIVRRQKSLDWTHIESALAPLVALKEEPEILHRLLARRDAP